MYDGKLCCFHEGRFTSVTRPSITFISCDGMLNTVRYSSTKGSQISEWPLSLEKWPFSFGKQSKCKRVKRFLVVRDQSAVLRARPSVWNPP